MTTGLLIALAAIFIAGMITGVVGLVSLASRREDRSRLEVRPPDPIARAGRYLTGLTVQHPDDAAWRRRRNGARKRAGARR